MPQSPLPHLLDDTPSHIPPWSLHPRLTILCAASGGHAAGYDSRPGGSSGGGGEPRHHAPLSSIISEEWLGAVSGRVYEHMWLFNGDCLANTLWGLSRLG